MTDIAGHLAVTKSSVVSALSGLEGKGLVEHERYGEVELTAQGALVAEEMYRRHRMLHEFLRDVVGVPDDIAARDACRIEHELSPETMECLERMLPGGRRRSQSSGENRDRHA